MRIEIKTLEDEGDEYIEVYSEGYYNPVLTAWALPTNPGDLVSHMFNDFNGKVYELFIARKKNGKLYTWIEHVHYYANNNIIPR